MLMALFAIGCSYYNAGPQGRKSSKTSLTVSDIQSASVELDAYCALMLAREGDEQFCICLNAPNIEHLSHKA